MPHRIHFSVLHASSTEKGYNMRELESHNHLVKGWLSSRFCMYPQEIILNLKEKIRLRQIQILSHEYLIPTRIDFYVGLEPPDHMTKTHHKEYKLLGHTGLSDNRTTAYKVRELKSVSVDAVGQYLRLVMDKNYVNKFNLFNQVGLIAINVIGDNKFTEDTDSEDPRLTNKKIIDEFVLLNTNFKDSEGDPVDPALIEAAAREGYISSSDDLAFDMYQDPEIATLIRKLEVKRNEAIQDTLFTLGKKLDKAIDNLKTAGEILSVYNIEKRKAVEAENYDLARTKKLQMEDYRRKLYKDMELQDLCRHCVIDFWYEKYSWDDLKTEFTPSREIPVRPPSHPFLRDPSLQREDLPYGLEHSPRLTAPFETAYTRDDERTIPKLASQKPDPDIPAPSTGTQSAAQSAADDGSQAGTSSFSDSGRGSQVSESSDTVTDELMEKIRKQSGPAIEIFGQELVIKVHSKNWSVREDGFKMLTSHLKKLDVKHDKAELRYTLNASVTLSIKGVKDKVFAVFTATLHLLGVILERWIPKHRLNTGQTVEIVLPEVMTRIGDTNVRLKSAAVEFIVNMATFKEVHSLKMVPRVCVSPFKPNMQAKLALTRLEILQKLVEKLGLDDKSGLTVENTISFAKHAMEHTQGSVREAAVNFILDIYKLKGSEVIGHLPSRDEPKVKANKSLYGKLFKGLSKFVVSQIKIKALANTHEPDFEITDDRDAVGLSNQEQSGIIEIKTEYVDKDTAANFAETVDDDMYTMRQQLANLKLKTRRDSVKVAPLRMSPITAPNIVLSDILDSPRRSPQSSLAALSTRRKSSPAAPSIVLPIELDSLPTSRKSSLTSLSSRHKPSLAAPSIILSNASDSPPISRKSSLTGPSFGFSNPSRMSTRTPFAPSALDTFHQGSSYNVDSVCVFCGEEDDAFQIDIELDEHYKNFCPMLMLCNNCKQLVEVSAYHEHLLMECPNEDRFAKCSRCHQVKKKSLIDKHINCSVLQENQTRCPLCNLALTQSDEQWQIHLLGNYGCKASVRRQLAVNRVNRRISPSSLKTAASVKNQAKAAQVKNQVIGGPARNKAVDTLPLLSKSKRNKLSKIPRPAKKFAQSI